MAKKSSIEKNKRRIKLSEKDLHKRNKLKSLIMDKKPLLMIGFKLN